MNNRLATILSFIFQPLLMGTYTFLILLFVASEALIPLNSSKLKWWFVLTILLTTFVIPVIGILVIKLTSGIKGWDLENRDDRVFPFFLIAIFYAMTAYLIVGRLNISPLVNTLLITVAMLVLLTAFITIFWKISIHSIGMGGMLGLLLAINITMGEEQLYIPVMITALVTGLVMSARLQLKVHKPTQVYLGVSLGFLFCFVSLLITLST